MSGALVLWSHALAAFLFGALTLWEGRRARAPLPRAPLLAALAVTALWSLAVAGIGMAELVTRLALGLRNLAWLGFMLAVLRRAGGARHPRTVSVVYGMVMLVVGLCTALDLAADAVPGARLVSTIDAAQLVLRMMVAAGALVLVHHLRAATVRGPLRPVLAALAMMWGADLVLFGSAYAAGFFPPAMVAVRGVVMVAAAPLLFTALQRDDGATLQPSRTIAWQSLILAAVAIYFGVVAVAVSALSTIGGESARVAQTAFVFGSTAAALTLASAPWPRAWAKVMLAKHLFRHRYDYRAEWLRFTETLGTPGEGAAPLDERIVKAVADLTDSPAGLLLVPEGPGLAPGRGWRWDGGEPAPDDRAEALAAHLAVSARIVALDEVRAGLAEPAEAAAVPGWILAHDGAWVVVPLVHLRRLVGAVLLARPPIARPLDWEDFDLLRVAGRQAASTLAEARAQEALGEAERFDEFNRRFAFILHDVKNLVSQLTLTARNAERHADNPAFRADMVATLQESAGRMNDLLARLSQHHNGRADPPRAVALGPLVERVAARRRAQHAVTVGGTLDIHAMTDPARLEQLLGHLVQNAIEASPSDVPVTVTVAEEGGRATIEVIDRGCGMTAAFVRDKLFRPFVSSKPGGFGIGAFEARELALAMGGRVEVTSREGEGTHFRVSLPAARATAPVLEDAA